MARVIRLSTGYEFSGLSASGMRLVNEFQRNHPELCEPSLDPSYRFIRCGSPQQTLQLVNLVADVNERDLEREIPSATFKRTQL